LRLFRHHRDGYAIAAIIKHFDAVKDVFSDDIPLFVDAFLCVFFQAARKGFGHSIIQTVSSATHVRFKVVLITESQPIIATVV